MAGSMKSKTAPPKDIDAYLAKVPRDAGMTLEKFRRPKGAAPKATEKISYGIPTFDHCGSLVAFAAFKKHLSFFPMSLSVIAAHKDDRPQRRPQAVPTLEGNHSVYLR